MATWIEQGSRGLAQVAMEDFPTVADAIFELADNPLDYRRGRPLEIEITIKKDRGKIVVEDRGGEGMDAEGVADWLKWGTGHPHVAGDIGAYHKGGKAACGYLADSVEILTRRAGTKEVWRFEDRHWRRRPDWADYGEPDPWTGDVPADLWALPVEVGFTRIILTDLEDRRYNIDTLRWKIGSTYRRLIEEGAVRFILNGEPVEPLALPESTAFKRRDEATALPSGRRIRWWVARLDRDAVRAGTHRIQGGMRLLYQKRLITEGEFFGHHAEGKGLLQSIIGEVEMNHVPPLSNKTGFKQGTPEWEEVAEAMNRELAPIIAEFRRAADETPVSREERKKANAVRRQLSAALTELASRRPGDGRGNDRDTQKDGRRPAKPGKPRPDPIGTHATSERQPRTEAPDDAVGVLRRLRRRLRRAHDVPPIEIRSLDPSLRSEVIRAGGEITLIVINKAYPMYVDVNGNEAYLAESALLELLMPAEGEKTPVAEYVAQVNAGLYAWAKVADAGAAAA